MFMASCQLNGRFEYCLLAKVNNWLGSVKDYLHKLNEFNRKSMIKCQIDCKVSGNVSSGLKCKRVAPWLLPVLHQYISLNF